MDEIELANIQIMLITGAEIRLLGVDIRDAQHARVHFVDWASLGGLHATKDEWPGSRVLELMSETTGQSVAVPFGAIAALLVSPAA